MQEKQSGLMMKQLVKVELYSQNLQEQNSFVVTFDTLQTEGDTQNLIAIKKETVANHL